MVNGSLTDGVQLAMSFQRRSAKSRPTRRPHSRVLQRHQTSMPARLRCSCSILIRRCRTWDYLALIRRILRHILQRSNKNTMTKSLKAPHLASERAITDGASHRLVEVALTQNRAARNSKQRSPLVESHAARTAPLPSASSLGSLQTACDGIPVFRAYGHIPRRQSR